MVCSQAAAFGRLFFWRSCGAPVRSWHKCEVPTVLSNVRFSNRPFGVKHFQTIHQCGVDVARGLVLLFGIGT
jgi:hypothetical protein